MGLVNILQGKDATFTLYVTDSAGHPIDITGWTLIRMRMPSFEGSKACPTGSTNLFVEKTAPLSTPVAEVQKLAFSGLTAGSYKIKVGSQLTDFIAYNATLLDIQNALNALTGFADIAVTGLAPNILITFAGGDSGRAQPLMTIANSTLVGGTPVITRITAGVPESGVDVVNAVQGAVAIVLSEDDTVALRVGQKLDMDLLVRIGAKDLNIPIIKGQLNVTKNPFL